MKKNVIIMGAAGRDFHNFNTFFRNNELYQVVAFTATQIPDIEGRKYPAALAGPQYSDGIPIYSEDDLAKLRLKDNVIATKDTAIKMLCEKHGTEAGIYYYGLLVSRLCKSKKRISQETQLHPRSLDRRLRKIVDSGISPTLTNREEPLPPLTIDF